MRLHASGPRLSRIDDSDAREWSAGAALAAGPIHSALGLPRAASSLLLSGTWATSSPRDPVRLFRVGFSSAAANVPPINSIERMQLSARPRPGYSAHPASGSIHSGALACHGCPPTGKGYVAPAARIDRAREMRACPWRPPIARRAAARRRHEREERVSAVPCRRTEEGVSRC